MAKEPLWTSNYVRMNLSCFFQYVTHYLLIAALPIFAIQTLNQSENQVGLVLTFFQIGAILFRPLAGRWMDRFDKKWVLAVSLAFFCGVCCLYLGVQSLWYLLAVRFLLGAGFAVGTTATATMVADLSPASRKGEGVGYFAVFTSIAMVLGPFFGLTLISVFPFDSLFAVVAACGLLAFLCGNIKCGQDHRAGIVPAPSAGWRGIIEPNALPIACCGVLLSIVYGSLLGFLPVYAREQGLLGLASWFFAVYALTIILTRPVIGKLFDRMGAPAVVYTSAACYFTGFVLLSNMQGVAGLLLSAALIGVGFGGLNPSFQALAVIAAPLQRSGLATATYLLSMDVGVGIGSVVMGIVASYTDFRTMYMVSAVLALVLAGVFHRVYRPR